MSVGITPDGREGLGGNGSGVEHHKLDGNRREGRGDNDVEAIKLDWNKSTKTEPRGPHERDMVNWARRVLGRAEEDELVLDGWLFLRSNQQNDFTTIDEAMVDFYAYIEWIESMGVSDLCSRVGAFIATEDTMDTHPQEVDQYIPEQTNNHTLGQTQVIAESSKERTSTNNHGKEAAGHTKGRLLDCEQEVKEKPPRIGTVNHQPTRRTRNSTSYTHNNKTSTITPIATDPNDMGKMQGGTCFTQNRMENKEGRKSFSQSKERPNDNNNNRHPSIRRVVSLDEEDLTNTPAVTATTKEGLRRPVVNITPRKAMSTLQNFSGGGKPSKPPTNKHQHPICRTVSYDEAEPTTNTQAAIATSALRQPFVKKVPRKATTLQKRIKQLKLELEDMQHDPVRTKSLIMLTGREGSTVSMGMKGDQSRRLGTDCLRRMKIVIAHLRLKGTIQHS